MSFRNDAARDEVFGGTSFGDAVRGMFRMGGGWGNVSGPSLFMLRVILSGTITSAFMGMAGASISAMVYDTATIPFMISACAGFMLGVMGFYRDVVRKSLRSLDRYPRLLQIHLDANFPHQGFNEWERGRFRSAVFSQKWTLQSMLVAAWMTATPALERIMATEEETAILAEEKSDKTERTESDDITA